MLGRGGEAKRAQIPGQNSREPGRPAGDAVELDESQVQHRADAERGHAEVVRLEPQRRDADDVGEGAGGEGGDRHAEPRREPVAHREHRRHVGAEPVEAGMAERDLSRIAHQEIQADGEDDVDPRHDHDVDEVLVGQEPGHHGHRRQEGHERPAGHPAGQRSTASPRRRSPSVENLRHHHLSSAGFAGATRFSGRVGGIGRGRRPSTH